MFVPQGEALVFRSHQALACSFSVEGFKKYLEMIEAAPCLESPVFIIISSSYSLVTY